MTRILFAIVAAAALTAAAASDTANGHWQGVMIAKDQSLPVSFDFSNIGGRFTSITQAAMDYPLDKVDRKDARISFTLGGSIVFDGTVENDTMRGTFKNGDLSGTFEFHHGATSSLPYDTQDVTFRNGDVVLKGTLCLPRTPGRHAAVVLLHGSGPQSRWGTTRFVADQFARAGIAALTYDKRGSGDSGGDWKTASYPELAKDALAGVDLLDARSDIDPHKIGLIGHSQGGAIAPLAASIAPGKIAFIVAEDTFAGPQWKQDIYRVSVAARGLELAPEDYQHAMNTYTLFVDAARGARPYEDFEKASEQYRNASWYAWMAFPSRDTWVWPWAKLNDNFDSLVVWRKVRVPVLLIYGEKDALGPVHEYIADIGAALSKSGAPHSTIIIPNAQHNLTIQPDDKGPFFWWHEAPGVIDTVVSWVKRAAAK